MGASVVCLLGAALLTLQGPGRQVAPRVPDVGVAISADEIHPRGVVAGPLAPVRRESPPTVMATVDSAYKVDAPAVAADDEGPALSGTVRLPSGAPASSAMVFEVYATRGGHREPIGWRFQCDDAGRFRIPIEAPLSRIEMLVADATGRHQQSYTFDVDLDRNHHLGELVFDALQHLVLHAVDSTGRGVAGACAVGVAAATPPPTAYAVSWLPASQPSQSDGLIRYAVPATIRRLLVSAAGFDIAEVPLPPASSPITVRLEAATLLTVRAQSPTNDWPRGLKIVLESAGPMLGDAAFGLMSDPGEWYSGPLWWEDARWAALHRPMVPRPDHTQRREGYSRIQFSGEEATVSGIVPGVEVRIRLSDAFSDIEVVERVTLALGERREVKLALPRAPRALRGWLLDRQGHAIADANLCIDGHGLGTTSMSDREGQFHFDGLLADRVDLRVHAEGFSCLSWRGLAVPPDEGSIEIVLERTREVVVTVLEQCGRPIEAASVAVEQVDENGAIHSASATSDVQGRSLLANAPVGRASIVVQVAGGSYAQPVESGSESATVWIPNHGALRVLVSPAPADDYAIRLEPIAGDGTAFEPWGSFAGDAEALVPYVMPGRYRVVASEWDDALEERLEIGAAEVSVHAGARSLATIVVAPR